jgi:flagellar hook-basal body complex protein FliE
MAVNFVSPAAAYQAAAKLGSAPGIGTEGAAGTGNKAFGDLLSDAMKDVTSTMRAGEAAATQGAAGQGDIVQVVNAVTAAELTLQTVVAVRDRVIAAYQDIMKMPI